MSVADQPMGLMGAAGEHAVVVAEGTRFLIVFGAATTNALTSTLTLSRPVTEIRYRIPGMTQTLAQLLHVTNPANLHDQNAGTLVLIGTNSLNNEGDGVGVWPCAIPGLSRKAPTPPRSNW